MTNEVQEGWVEAKRQAVETLSAYARDRDTISYKDFVAHIKAIPDLKHHGDKRLDDLLDEISSDQEAAGVRTHQRSRCSGVGPEYPVKRVL
jgi:hypothetical protein